MDGARVARLAMGHSQHMANEAERVAGLVTDEARGREFTADDWHAELKAIQVSEEDEFSLLRKECLDDFYNLPWREQDAVVEVVNDGGFTECDKDKEPNPKPYAFINGTPLHKREYKPPPPQPPPLRYALCLEDVKLDTMFTECAHMFCKSCCVRGHYLFDADNLKNCPGCRTELPSSSIKIALYP